MMARDFVNIVFMGSDTIACPSLECLYQEKNIRIVKVVTQPDRPKGRRRKLAPCDLKCRAQELGLPVISPEKIGGSVDELRSDAPDLIVVVAYGQYIPQKVLEVPEYGAINLHPSLLPKYRGASPIQEAVAQGEIETGVTVLYVSREMDAGDILAQQVFAIRPEENAVELGQRLSVAGAKMFPDVIKQIMEGSAKAVPQDESCATCVHKLTKEDGRIDWKQDSETINNAVRGYQPWPICYTGIPTENGTASLRIYRAVVCEGSGTPGEVLNTKGGGPVVATGNGALRLLDVQPPGKKRMTGAALVCGRYVHKGMCFE